MTRIAQSGSGPRRFEPATPTIHCNEAEQSIDASTPTPPVIAQPIGTGSPGKMPERVNSTLHPVVAVTLQLWWNRGLPKLTL